MSGDTVKKGGLKKKIDEELICDICHERLKQPKSLTQCSHSFCQSCLEGFFAYSKKSGSSSLQEDQLECPKCRKVTTLPQGKVAELPTNHALQNVAEILSEEPEGDEQEPQEVCQQHQSVLNQYCGTCNELLCSECIHDPKHKEHLQREQVHFASKILPECLEFLSKQLQPASELASQVERLKNEVEKKRRVVSSNGEETENEIEAFFSEMARHLEERKKTLISAVENDVKSKLATMDAHSDKLEEIGKSTLSMTNTVKKLCQSRDIHALTEGKVIEDELQQCQRSLDNLDTQLQDGGLNLLLKFQEERSVEQHLSSLGTLTVCEAEPETSYLKVKHQLRVRKDGNVFKDAPSATPTLQARYITLTRSDEAYVTMDYAGHQPVRVSSEMVTSAAYQPLNLPFPPPENATYDQVPPSGRQRSDIRAQYQVEGNPKRPRSPRDSVDESEYENVSPHVMPVAYMDVVPRKTSVDDSGSESEEECEEGVYDVIPGSKPPLPPDNLYRSLGQQAGRQGHAKTGLKYNQRSFLNASTYESVAAPANRPEQEILKPVKVISNDQLREPESNEEVYPTGICTNAVDIITVTDLHNHSLRQVDQHGTFIQTFGRKGRAAWDFDSPTSVAANADHLYVANRANGLAQKLTVDGEHLSTFGRKHLQLPWGIAISQINGNIYVSDSEKKRVYVYGSNCKYVRPIGKHEKDIHFEHPVGVAFDTAGNLLVADRGQVPCIWHIDISQPEGKLLGKIGEHYLHYPSDITVTKDGSIVVTERGKANCISVFSPQGKVIRCFGKTGSNPGEFNGPCGVTVNSLGQIIIADQHNQRLQIFDFKRYDKDPVKETD